MGSTGNPVFKGICLQRLVTQSYDITRALQVLQSPYPLKAAAAKSYFAQGNATLQSSQSENINRENGLSQHESLRRRAPPARFDWGCLAFNQQVS